MTHVDSVILGSGPGGHTAAIRAAQLGLKVAIVERRSWGGAGLNAGGAVLTSLLRQAELVDTLRRRSGQFGIGGDLSFDYGAAFRRSREVADRLSRGVDLLLRKNKIAQFDGDASFLDARTVLVTAADATTETLTFDHCVIAVGASQKPWANVKLEGRVVGYRNQLMADRLPGSIVIGGAGAHGVEFAYLLAGYGVGVTLVERQDRLLPSEDAEVSAEIAKACRARGIKTMTGTTVTAVSQDQSGAHVTASASGREVTVAADRVLVAAGFSPRTQGYGLERAGVALTEAGAIAVDEAMRTNVDGLYAVGDVTGRAMSAQTAAAQAMVAAETMAGRPTWPIDYDMMPRVVFGSPQVAAFGYTADQARQRGYDPVVAKYPLTASGAAWSWDQPVGFVKIVADAKHHELLGAHLVGAEVAELLPELTLAKMWDLTADEIARNFHAHPTLSEAIEQACQGVSGPMIGF